MQRRGPPLRQHSCHVEHSPNSWTLPGMDRNMCISRFFRRCYRCGHPYTQNHLSSCPATRSACFQCGKLGHFSRLCFYRNVVSHQHVGTDRVSCESTRHPQQSSSLRNNRPETVGTFAISPKQGDKQKKFKSAAKRRRDSKRMSAYRRQKEIMCLFPFSDLNSTDFNEVTACVIPNNVHIRALQHRTTELQRKLKTVSNELEQLQTKSKPTTKETFTQIDYLNWDNLQYYRDQISKLKARCAHNTTVINDIKKQLQDKNITLKDRNITISDLTTETEGSKISNRTRTTPNSNTKNGQRDRANADRVLRAQRTLDTPPLSILPIKVRRGRLILEPMGKLSQRKFVLNCVKNMCEIRYSICVHCVYLFNCDASNLN